MTTFEITYMVDPGDGIESVDMVTTEEDDMVNAIHVWQRDHEYFITKCEIVDHSLMG